MTRVTGDRPGESLLAETSDTGFMHESFGKKNSESFTRPWFVWADSLFGELIINFAHCGPEVLRQTVCPPTIAVFATAPQIPIAQSH
jgi:hypothetical protein